MIGLVHLCSLSRNQTVGTNGRRAMSQLYASMACLFIPMGSRTAIENQFSIGRAYDVFFDAGQDVKAGDQLIFNGSTFAVRFVLSYTGVSPVNHLHAMCEQEIA